MKSLIFSSLVLLLAATPAQAVDLLFRANFQPVTDAPASDAEAARFLTQATFGPTRDDIAQLRRVGIGQWLDQQMSMPPTLARPHLEALNASAGSVDQNDRLDRWFHTALYGRDQLRQRMAYALSQIVVISDQDGNLNGQPIMVGEYQDILARRAFDNYRSLLGEITRSPMMGIYLTYLRNRAAYTPNGATQPILPDENYAREIMQLFTIGLVKRNLDFSPRLDGQGQPIPTYSQDTIVNLARVFTGLTYANSTSFTSGPRTFAPMVCFPINAQGQTYHDNAAKVLLDGFNSPAVPNTVAGCNLDLENALTHLFAQSNVAPFISRQLIQRFVTSNPSPQYIARVAAVFNNNGSGGRGDLAAVLRAILLDSEARNYAGNTGGKVREPLLRLVALQRAFRARPTANGEYQVTTSDYLQRPLGAPTVFNFYEPDYQQPGPIAAQGLYSPELQILSESTVVTIANSINTRTFSSWVGMTNPPNNRPLIDLADLTPLTTNPAALVNEIDLRMTYGRMSTAMKTVLVNMLGAMPSNTTSTRRVLAVIHLVAISPEFSVQR